MFILASWVIPLQTLAALKKASSRSAARESKSDRSNRFQYQFVKEVRKPSGRAVEDLSNQSCRFLLEAAVCGSVSIAKEEHTFIEGKAGSSGKLGSGPSFMVCFRV